MDNWNSTIAVDVTAAMLCTREVLNQSMLQRRSGVILNFSSTAGYHGVARKSHYVTAKASLRAFTKSVALEVDPHGIRCNCIVPGAIDTELWRNWVQRTSDERGVDFETQRAKSLKDIAMQGYFLCRGRGQPGVVPGRRREQNHYGAIHPRRRGRIHAGMNAGWQTATSIEDMARIAEAADRLGTCYRDPLAELAAP